MKLDKKSYPIVVISIILLIFLLSSYWNILSPAAIYGMTTINSVPEGVTVTLNGNVIGTTPFTYFSYGLYEGNTLVFSKENYITKTYEITPFSRSPIYVALDYDSSNPNAWRLPSVYDIQISTSPPGAEIYDGSNLLGKSPYTLTLSQGESKHISLRLSNYNNEELIVSYDDKNKYIFMRSNYVAPTYTSSAPTPTTTPTVTQSTMGTVSISSTPNGASIFIDGVYRGTTPLTMTLSPNTHDIKLLLDKYDTISDYFTIQSGKSITYTKTLTLIPGYGSGNIGNGIGTPTPTPTLPPYPEYTSTTQLERYVCSDNTVVSDKSLCTSTSIFDSPVVTWGLLLSVLAGGIYLYLKPNKKRR